MSKNAMFLQWGELCNGSVTPEHHLVKTFCVGYIQLDLTRFGTVG